MPFSVYDVTLFIGLPVTGKIVEFGEDDFSMTELARMVCLRMTQYVTEKSNNQKSEKGKMRPVVRNYICLLYTSPSPRDGLLSRMPSSA